MKRLRNLLIVAVCNIAISGCGKTPDTGASSQGKAEGGKEVSIEVQPDKKEPVQQGAQSTALKEEGPIHQKTEVQPPTTQSEQRSPNTNEASNNETSQESETNKLKDDFKTYINKVIAKRKSDNAQFRAELDSKVAKHKFMLDEIMANLDARPECEVPVLCLTTAEALESAGISLTDPEVLEIGGAFYVSQEIADRINACLNDEPSGSEQ